MKLKYFEIEWIDHPDWVEIAQSKSKALWESEYRSLSHQTTLISIQPDSAIDSQNLNQSEAGSAIGDSLITSNSTLSRWKKIKRAKLTNDDLDQWNRFQSTEEVEEVEDLLGYWATRLKNPRWTQLSHMALEIHSIAAMSAQVERVFSRLVSIHSSYTRCSYNANNLNY